MSLENFAMRDKIRFNHTVGLRSETSADQLRHVLIEVRRMLSQHPKVEQPSARVRLIGVRNSAIEIEVFAYVMATSWEVFLEAQEEMLLHVIDIVEASGTTFASQGLPAFGVDGTTEAVKGRKDEKARPRKKQDRGELL
jgi:MscS family membrane protein